MAEKETKQTTVEQTTEVKKRKTKYYWIKEVMSNGTEEQKTTIDNIIKEYREGIELADLKKQRDELDKKIKKLEKK